MVKIKDVFVKMSFTGDLTEVQVPNITEEVQVAAMRIRSRLMNIVMQPKAESLSYRAVKSAYKYDRIIAIDAEGKLKMFPIKTDLTRLGIDPKDVKGVLLSELMQYPDVFYACSSPVIVTSEHSVRSAFIPSTAAIDVVEPDGSIFVKGQSYSMAGVAVKCIHYNNYFGATPYAIMETIFCDSDNTKEWDRYAKQVLTGEVQNIPCLTGRQGAPIVAGTKDAPVVKPAIQHTPVDGHLDRAKDYDDCVDKLLNMV